MQIAKRPKPPKIEVYPKDEKEKAILNLVTADAAELGNTTKSAVVLNPVRERYLPQSKRGLALVEMMADHDGVQGALMHLYIHSERRFDLEDPRGKSAVEALGFLNDATLNYKLTIEPGSQKAKETATELRALSNIMAKTDIWTVQEGIALSAKELDTEVSRGRELADELDSALEDSAHVPAWEICGYLVNSQPLLGHLPVFHRTVSNLCAAICEWPDIKYVDGEPFHMVNPNGSRLRTDTIALINKLTSRWDAEDAVADAADTEQQDERNSN